MQVCARKVQVCARKVQVIAAIVQVFAMKVQRFAARLCSRTGFENDHSWLNAATREDFGLYARVKDQPQREHKEAQSFINRIKLASTLSKSGPRERLLLL